MSNEINVTMQSAEKIVGEKWDVVIIGAGPAGSVCAIHLADSGKKVLLVDKSEFPREKICGDGLIADSINALKRAGLEDQVRSHGHSFGKGKIFSPSRRELIVPGDFLTLKRNTLDAIVAQKAVAAGAVFCRAKVKDIDIKPDGVAVCLTENGGRIESTVAVVATGVLIDLLEKHGMVADRRPTAMAVRCYIKSTEELDELLISYDRSILPGYSWIFPMGGGEYNVGCGVHLGYVKGKKPGLRRMFDVFCDNFPVMRRLMSGMTERTELKSAQLRCGMSGGLPVGKSGNLLAIGESIGTTFPFTGEGIGKAMESGELAAGVLNDAFDSSDFSRLRDFGAIIKKKLENKYLGYRVAERWISYPWLNDFMIQRINKSDYFRESMIGIVNETTDPRTIFSLKGLLHSLIK